MFKKLLPVLSLLFIASMSHADDSADYQARVTDAANHFLADVSLVKLALVSTKNPSKFQICYELGALNYTTNQLFNLAANGGSGEARRTAAKKILEAKAAFEVSCGWNYKNTEAFQLFNSRAKPLTNFSQIEAKLAEVESIAKQIQQGEVR